jgi:catechol 2,3-dioxygenase-like lactoylglutathione lyase family enzyme
MKTPPAILETALYCEDLDKAREFYSNVLGLEIIAEGEGRHVFFMLEGSVLLIFNPHATDKPSQAARFSVPPHGAQGPGHACFRADGEALDQWRTRLQEAGVEIEEEITWPNGARSIYFRDPAGNSLEFGEGGLWNI